MRRGDPVERDAYQIPGDSNETAAGVAWEQSDSTTCKITSLSRYYGRTGGTKEGLAFSAVTGGIRIGPRCQAVLTYTPSHRLRQKQCLPNVNTITLTSCLLIVTA